MCSIKLCAKDFKDHIEAKLAYYLIGRGTQKLGRIDVFIIFFMGWSLK